MTTHGLVADASAHGDHPHPGGFTDGVARLRRALRRACRSADPDNPLAVAQLELMSALAERPAFIARLPPTREPATRCS